MGRNVWASSKNTNTELNNFANKATDNHLSYGQLQIMERMAQEKGKTLDEYLKERQRK